MRNLLLFFTRFHNFFFFLFFEVICLSLIVRNNSFQRSSFLNSTSSMTGSIYSAYHVFTEYLGLREVNEELARENAFLRQQLKAAYFNNKFELGSVTDTAFRQKYTYIPCQIINNSFRHTNNYLTLNKGSRQGIAKGMGVISSNGIVGIVKHVSANYASVMSLLHRSMNVSAKLTKNDYFGSLVWEGIDHGKATLLDIPKNISLAVGDSIATSGYSAFFPENISIGVIESFDLEKGDNFYNISVSLTTNFENLSHVYVVNNLMKIEQLDLENRNSNDQ